MDKQKKNRLLQTVQEINRVTIISGVGFLAYLGVRIAGLETVAGIISIVFTIVAAWAFFSAIDLRGKDKEAASYNMIWGTGALTILLGACAALQMKLWFGL